MGKQNDVGVFQLESGSWAYRYTFKRNGKRFSRQGSKDEFGAPLRTKKDAIKARQAAIEQEQDSRKPAPIVRKTVKEVYQEYCTNGRKDRAYQTIRKQDSLWENHISKRFGKRFVDEISVAEVNDYLGWYLLETKCSSQYSLTICGNSSIGTSLGRAATNRLASWEFHCFSISSTEFQSVARSAYSDGAFFGNMISV